MRYNRTARYSGTTSISINAVAFVSLNKAFAIGSGGSVLKTSDGGINWVVQQSGTVNALNAISVSDEDTGTAVGDSGTILRTAD